MRMPWQKRHSASALGTGLIAVCCGAAGVALGLLFAPKTGPKMRAQLRRVAVDLLSGAGRRLTQARSSAKKMARSGIREVERLPFVAAK
jgi:hypothetical protein